MRRCVEESGALGVERVYLYTTEDMGVTDWYRRLGWAHTLSLMVALWGIFLAGREILPRIGYAKHIAYWVCS